MRSSVLAMLWENWRLTRVEAGWKLALGIVGGLAALVAFAAMPVARNEAAKDAGAVIALFLIVFLNITGWLSIPKINGGRPGFPFELLYTRPLRTAVIVAVPMAYLAAMPAASYLVSALLLRVTSGFPFPLVPVAAWIAAVNLAHAPTNWSINKRVVTLVGSLAAGLAWLGLASLRVSEIPGRQWTHPSQWPAAFDFPLTDYVLIASIALASFGLTVAGVARQRHGDAPAAIAWPWTGTAFPDWLINLLRFPCPTSSATRAQVWFDLKSRGLPILAIGVVLAIVNPLLFAISVPMEFLRPVAAMSGMGSVLAVLVLGGNAFGIRWRPGSLYASTFEVTQPYGTVRLAGLKVLVRSLCMLAALVAAGVSVWASLAFIAVGEGREPLLGYQPLRSWQHAIESVVGALTGYQQVALAVVATIGIAVMVASFAAFKALAARYPRDLGMSIAGWLLLLHGLLLVPLVLTGYHGVGSQALWKFLLDVLVWITRWIDAPMIALATVYVVWSAFAEGVLTPRAVCAAVLVSLAFGAAWLTMLRAAGLQLADIPTMHAIWVLSPALLPLMASVLAPWSLNRIRHV
jgi:hypothetical protein